MVDSAFDRAEQRSNQVSHNLRQGVQSSFADISTTLSDAEKRAAEAAEAMRSSVSKASEDVNATLDTTLGNAERRSGELANRVRGGLTASLSEVERMMGDAGRLSDGAAQQMRESLREAVDEAVARFSGATEEIRRSAGDIRKELDMTRSELKRGAFDLPEEAKESAAAMRRAVSEQIKALQDISHIVGRSTQQLEVSEPAARTLAQPQQPQPAPRQAPVQPAIQQQPQPAPVPAPAPAPLPTPAAAAIPPSSIEGFGLRGSLGTAAATPATPQRAPAVTQAPAASPASGGWISDLLRGASRDESAEEAVARQPAPRVDPPAPQAPRAGDNRNPRHVVESLNSLSVDIARAIDHDASVDLWRRYQRGERDVFTRRLYTLKGQQTFDEIKHKYDREPEFRTAVNRYIADFEKLLADVARTDRDRTITQSYLTSDTGKVYTMLAHAAGRLN
jgi:ElaB/YqjD/DUF883 family membrane-anchored ribosome-binding protein